MNFCSKCGSEKLDFTIPEGDHKPRYVCSNCERIHYQNPRVIVGCLATWENKILLCRRNIEPRKELWNLPCGFLEEGETVEEGAARETFEEAQARVRIIRPFTIFNLPNFSQLYIHFLAEMESPEIGITNESSEVKLFSPEDIPFDEMAFHSSTFSLQKYLEFGTSNAGIHMGTHRLNSL